jgi:sec-independent protein translocase protein TatA
VLAIFQQFGTSEILIILFILLILFGAKKLPEMGKGLGKGIREFRDATKGIADDVKSGIEGEDEPKDRRPSGTPSDGTKPD